MLRTKLSVAGIVIIGLVATATLLLGGMGYAGYRSFGDRQREEFRQGHAILADQLAASLTLPLWNFDRDQIGKVIESAMQQDDIYRVEVRPAEEAARVDRRSRDSNWKITVADGGVASAGLQVERRNIAMAGEIIGEVHLFTTDRFLQRRLRRT